MQELELAHQDYEKRKNEMLTKLDTIKRLSKVPVLKLWCDQISEFIKEKEV